MENKWNKRVLEHRDKVLEKYPEDQVLGVFLYGSQNYGIATDESDVDTKAIIIPSMQDLLFNQPISIEMQFENNEHCEVKDIREMVKMFKKQNINFLEILFTDYYWVNPIYEKIWNEYFIKQKEQIAKYDPVKMFASITGQAMHTLNQNQKDNKKIANAKRLKIFLSKTVLSFSHPSSLNYNPPFKDKIELKGYLRNMVLAIKNGKYTKNEVSELIKDLSTFKSLDMNKYVNPYLQKNVNRNFEWGIEQAVRLLDKRRRNARKSNTTFTK